MPSGSSPVSHGNCGLPPAPPPLPPLPPPRPPLDMMAAAAPRALRLSYSFSLIVLAGPLGQLPFFVLVFHAAGCDYTAGIDGRSQWVGKREVDLKKGSGVSLSSRSS